MSNIENKMSFNKAPKFLLNQSGDLLQPINTQFSGIFNKSLFTHSQDFHHSESSKKIPMFIKRKNNPIQQDRSPQLSESSNSTVETIDDYEFLTPHTKKIRQVSTSPNNFSHILDHKQMAMIEKVAKNVPSQGNLTFKMNAENDLTNIIYIDISHSKVINHNVIPPRDLGLLASSIHTTSTSNHVQLNAPPVNPPVKRKVGRPRRLLKDELIKESEEDELLNHRTKSGRIVKLKPEAASIFQVDNNVLVPPIPSPEISQEKLNSQLSPGLLPGLAEPSKKPRRISSQFRCPLCKKIYLGKNKMNHHFKLFPNHRPKVAENESALFSHLMTLVRHKKKNKEMADLFFKEISNFVQICEKLTPRLITNQDNPNTHKHFVDKNSASLLRINPGSYRLNMNVFDNNFKLDNPPQPETEPMAINNEHDNDETHTSLELEPKVITAGNEVIKALDDVPSLDGNEVNMLIRQTNELTNLTNISDIVGVEDF